MSARSSGSFLSKFVLVPAVVVMGALAACGGTSTSTSGGSGGGTTTTSGTGSGSTTSSSSGGTGNAANGKTIVNTNACVACHQQAGSSDVLSGSTTPVSGFNSTYGRNLTPDKATGLGNWTTQQIEDAISKGIRNDGTMLCSQMIHYTFSASDLADVTAYLQSIPAVSHTIPTSNCQ